MVFTQVKVAMSALCFLKTQTLISWYNSRRRMLLFLLFLCFFAHLSVFKPSIPFLQIENGGYWSTFSSPSWRHMWNTFTPLRKKVVRSFSKFRELLSCAIPMSALHPSSQAPFSRHVSNFTVLLKTARVGDPSYVVSHNFIFPGWGLTFCISNTLLSGCCCRSVHEPHSKYRGFLCTPKPSALTSLTPKT